MNKRIENLALDAGLLNYFDNETPRRYFIPHIDLEEVEDFAKLIVRECSSIIESQDVDPAFKSRIAWAVKEHFGVE
jgi:hypothetical protein